MEGQQCECGRVFYGSSPDGRCGWCVETYNALAYDILARNPVLGTPDSWSYEDRYKAAVFDALSRQDGGLDWASNDEQQRGMDGWSA